MPSPLLVATSVTTSLAMGLVPVLFRNLRGLLGERLSLGEHQLDRLDRLLLLSWIGLMPLAGWLVDHWGLVDVLFAGSLLLGITIAWLAAAQNIAAVRWGVAGLAIAGAGVTTAGVVLMPTALRLVPNWSLGAALCLGFVCVGLASLASGLIPRLVKPFGYRQIIVSLGLLTLVPATLIAVAKSDLPPAPPTGTESILNLRFLLLALAVFLYFPMEQAVQLWPGPFLVEIGYGRTVVRLVAGFWVSFLALRFGLAWMIRAGAEAWLILTLLAISSMVLGNLAGGYAPSSGYFGFWLVGGCYGPLFPTLLAILLDLESTRGVPGQAIGYVFALSALSSLVVNPTLAAYAKAHPARESMRITLLLGLLMAAPVLVIALIRFAK